METDQQQQDGGDQMDAPRPGAEDSRKLFVGGLDLETTEQQIRDHFGGYGDVQSVALKTNPQTGRSKGFAFVVFGSEDAANAALADTNNHSIAGKAVDVKKAKARPGKIFVGGVALETTDAEIRAHFSQFGNVTAVDMPFDKVKNQRKPFAFVTFESELVVRDLLKTPKQTIGGKSVDVKRANQDQRGGGGGGGRGGGGGWGGGGGGWGGGGGGSGGWGGGYDSYGGGYGGGGGSSSWGGGGYGGYTDFGGGGGGGGFKAGRGRGRGRGSRHQPY